MFSHPAAPLVSKAAVARILDMPVDAIERFECWASVAFIVFTKGLGLRPRFMSYSKFSLDGAALRVETASKLPGKIKDLGGLCFKVQSSKKRKDGTPIFYSVDLALHTCGCDDYTFRRTPCKHQRLAAAFSATRQTVRLVEAAEREAEREEVIRAGELAAASIGW